ncbi:hypothetical protein [Arthrobacter sp. fls2-241-R2A-172]|uniref:hypothetical protein n=1 Tax=Arthrobacter sp. fls2-241-R2A-172 TaxID=3040325 RepID=UPI00254C9A26|nr:hypothetical protein [Arthrobacter sp. fls2-241-R2A-172]
MRGELTMRASASVMVFFSAVTLLAGCTGPGTGAPAAETPSAASQKAITVEVNQSRDQYGKQAIQIQLTNTTDASLTVSSARLKSPLFEQDIVWRPSEGGLVLPPKQPKSVPTALPAPACDTPKDTSTDLTAKIDYAEAGKDPVPQTSDASDPFGVLPRNAGELCLAAQAADVASMVLDPKLEVAADGGTAVVRLLITPAADGGSHRTLTIQGIDGTPLLAEADNQPWPRDVKIRQGAGPTELALGIRPARCDPHAVAEDKVGTLLPLRVKVGDREGLLKIAASVDLRGRIYDFVTAACGDG